MSTADKCGGFNSPAPIAAAELHIGSAFNDKWSRPVCLRAWCTDGSEFVVSDVDGVLSQTDQCQHGRAVVDSWKAPATENSGVCFKLDSMATGALGLWRMLSGHLSHESRSFLQVRLHAADALGDEVFALRDGDQATLWRPVSWHRYFSKLLRLEMPSYPRWEVGMRVAQSETMPEQASTLTLPNVQQCAARSAQQAFFSGDWQGRVCSIEEHCRPANLGLWGWLFGLKHSVLAVHCQQLGPNSQPDCFYLDKNLDLGVCLRRAGRGETFTETPRDGYAWNTDMSLQDLWKAVSATAAFNEDQRTSNCQHFVREVLEGLSAEGWISASSITFRNQTVADFLRDWRYLGDNWKPAEAGAAHTAFEAATSGGCKAGVAVSWSTWAARFVLEKTERFGVE